MLNVPTRVQLLICCLIVFTIGIAPPAQATPPTPEFMAWWKALLQGGETGPAIDGVMLDYSVTDASPLPTHAEVDALRSQIKDLISHPFHTKLAQMEARLKNSDAGTRRRVWRMGESWRLSSDPIGLIEGVGYLDQVWTPSHGWQMTANNLVTGDPTSIAGSQFRIDVTSSGIAHDVATFFNGQLGAAASQFGESKVAPRMRSSDAWTLACSVDYPNGGGKSLHAEGAWDAISRQGTVRQVKWINRPVSGKAQEELIKLSDWKVWDGYQYSLASNALVLIDEVPQSRYTVQALVPYSKDEFAALVKAPRAIDTDPIRGAVTYRSVVQLGEGVQRYGVVEHGEITFTNAENPSRSIRIAGWCVLASLIVAAIVVHIRTKK